MIQAISLSDDLRPLVHAAVAVAHGLASAAWFGSMFYRLAVLQPRARAYFETDAEFETFVATIAQGARWKVLGAFTFVAATGAALVPLTMPQPLTTGWLSMIATKVVLLLAALAMFCYASWRLWPARVFARPEDVPRLQARFKLVGISLICLVGASIALGIAAHVEREY